MSQTVCIVLEYVKARSSFGSIFVIFSPPRGDSKIKVQRHVILEVQKLRVNILLCL